MYPIQSRPGGGYPIQSQLGVPPSSPNQGGGGSHPVATKGVLHPVPKGGIPIQSQWGYPIQSRQGVSPSSAHQGVPPILTWEGGTPPHPDLGRGYPLSAGWDVRLSPSVGVDGQTFVKILPSPSFGCEW